MKNITKALAAGAIASLALAGCGNGGGGSSSGGTDVDLSEVEYEGTVSIITRYAGDFEAYFEQMAAKYEELHPGVTVDVQQESDQGYKDKIKTLTASQSLPDIYFTWAGDYAAQFYENGLVLDLTEVIAPGTEWGDTFAPSALDAYNDDGTYYGIPFALDAKFMVYNKAIFAEAGLDVPGDHDELIEACRTLSDMDVVPMAFGNIDGWPALHYITQLNSYNVPPDTLQADFDPETATWDHPGYLASLEQFEEILLECTVTQRDANGSDYYTERDAFSRGEAAMFYVENLEFGATVPDGSQAEKDGYGIFKLPVADGAEGDPGSLTGAPDGFLINSRSKNPALAIDFMKFVTSTENAAELTAMTGIPSPVQGSLSDANSTEQLRESIDVLQSATSMSIWLDTVTVPEVADAWLSGVQGFISGDRTAAEVMEAIQAASEAAKG